MLHYLTDIGTSVGITMNLDLDKKQYRNKYMVYTSLAKKLAYKSFHHVNICMHMRNSYSYNPFTNQKPNAVTLEDIITFVAV